MAKKTCSFCGRSDRDVKLLISGINGFICEDCAKQAFEIANTCRTAKARRNQSPP